jgi:NAD(P)-dependent dehydrogenase (short-subunit alcohol dehydrogenase family)
VPPQVFNECNSTTQLLTTTIGIGRQTAIALSNAGWNVVLTARRLGALLETSELLRDSSACLTVAGDIADEDFVKDLFSSAIAEFGEHGGSITLW